MPDDPKTESIPPQAGTAPAPIFHRRRRRSRRLPFLLSILTGLLLFFAFIPADARATLGLAAWDVLRAQWPLAAMLLLFALIALSLVWSVGGRIDVWVFQHINLRGRHPRWLDRAMWLATQLGNMVTAMLAAGLFALSNDRNMAAEIILGTLILWLVVEAIKALTGRARPFLGLEGTRVLGWRERGNSFPSGHTAQAFFLATLISQQAAPGIGITVLLYGVAVLVGFTRVYVGVHYPRDVLGGAVLGCAAGVLATLVNGYWLALRF